MDIPNLSQIPVQETPKSNLFSLPLILIILTVAVTSGFFISRYFPSNSSSASINSDNGTAISAENISSASDVEVGKIYGKPGKDFNDTAIGIIEKGDINGEGTHILIREGGLSQRASLNSSSLDLDLFINKKVEVKGQTQASTKTAWFLDVGSIKVLE